MRNPAELTEGLNSYRTRAIAALMRKLVVIANTLLKADRLWRKSPA